MQSDIDDTSAEVTPRAKLQSPLHILSFLFCNPRFVVPTIKNFFKQRAVRSIPSQYRDSGQLSINSEVTFTPDFFKKYVEIVLHKDGADDRRLSVGAGGDSTALKDALNEGYKIVSFTPISNCRPCVSKESVVYSSFRPNRVVLNEFIETTFVGKNLPDVTLVTEVVGGSDLMLTGAFCGSLNVFPSAPSSKNGIHGSCFAPGTYGVAISWPTINAGVPFTAQHTILETVLDRCKAPEGYDPVPRTITVKIFMSMFGPQLR